MMNADITTRIEKDLIGHREINNDHYYGVQTLRALENFNLTNSKVGNFPNLIKALAMVKLACAEANYNLKNLDQTKFEAIEYSCNQLIRGNFHDQFPIDMMQGGAGTSTNMNANEVLANVALEYMGHSKGQYQYLHPNNDINMSQSTNDVYPTAIRLGLLLSLDELNLPFNNLILSFLNKSQEFAHILKMGRTQLQDAVPMTLGQEFGAFAVTLQKDLEQINTLIPNVLAYMNLGGTAIGTGITTEYSYRELAIQALGKISGKKIKSAPDLIEATSDMGDFVLLSGLLKRTALAVTLAAEAGQLQLNAMEPLIAFKLFESMDLLGKAMAMFQTKCIDTITANPEHCKALVENSIGIVTALNPYLGYETTTRIAKTANETGQSVLALVQNEGLLSAQVLDDILSINNMVKPKMSA
ncbi:aspartate ammonia-lyase [Acinetobacter baumannii]|nr:lyase family protein [Acinetobacter baumannii]OUJ94910.1 aspartate ammonia-lyase [Acinetobacter baumannii]